MTQLISSKATSLNQVPATFKRVAWVSGTINLDIGSGGYTKFAEALANVGVTNYSYDPYHLTAEENATAISNTREITNTVTVNNVLNVIAENESRFNVIAFAHITLSPTGTAYFLIYQGDKSGEGKATTKGWQCNKKANEYESEISAIFKNVQRKGNLIIAKKS